jgi:hypothetical protein
MSIFEVSKHIVQIIFYDRVLHVHAIIVRHHRDFGVKRYNPEVVVSFISSLKRASCDLLVLLVSFRGLWYNSTKCWRVWHAQ